MRNITFNPVTNSNDGPIGIESQLSNSEPKTPKPKPPKPAKDEKSQAQR